MANNAFPAFPPLRRHPGQPVLHPAVLDLERGVLIRDGENVLQVFVRLPEIPSIPCCHERGVIMFYVKLKEISNASRTERLAELMTTNTNVDELVEYNKYLIVDKL